VPFSGENQLTVKRTEVELESVECLVTSDLGRGLSFLDVAQSDLPVCLPESSLGEMWVIVVAVLAAVVIMVGCIYGIRRFLASQSSPLTTVYRLADVHKQSDLATGNLVPNNRSVLYVERETPNNLIEQPGRDCGVEMVEIPL